VYRVTNLDPKRKYTDPHLGWSIGPSRLGLQSREISGEDLMKSLALQMEFQKRQAGKVSMLLVEKIAEPKKAARKPKATAGKKEA
jgi:hypothetical protein